MSIKKIRELVDLMNENELGEVELEQEGLKVKLVKTGQGIVQEALVPRPQAVVPAPVSQGPAPAEQGHPPAGLKEITSPMVGTFYQSPSPEEGAYVRAGDQFKEGDVLCIVEAMKLMNEVKAECSGKIVQILVENAEPVEFGQALFLVEPA